MRELNPWVLEDPESRREISDDEVEARMLDMSAIDYERMEMGSLLWASVARLTVRDARIVTDWAYGKTEQQLADEHNVSQPRINFIIRRALKRLREMFGVGEDDAETVADLVLSELPIKTAA